jgi:hypothetical protein
MRNDQAEGVLAEAVAIARAGGELRDARARFMFVAGFRRAALEDAAQRCEILLQSEPSHDVERALALIVGALDSDPYSRTRGLKTG